MYTCIGFCPLQTFSRPCGCIFRKKTDIQSFAQKIEKKSKKTSQIPAKCKMKQIPVELSSGSCLMGSDQGYFYETRTEDFLTIRSVFSTTFWGASWPNFFPSIISNRILAAFSPILNPGWDTVDNGGSIIAENCQLE